MRSEVRPGLLQGSRKRKAAKTPGAAPRASSFGNPRRRLTTGAAAPVVFAVLPVVAAGGLWREVWRMALGDGLRALMSRPPLRARPPPVSVSASTLLTDQGARSLKNSAAGIAAQLLTHSSRPAVCQMVPPLPAIVSRRRRTSAPENSLCDSTARGSPSWCRIIRNVPRIVRQPVPGFGGVGGLSWRRSRGKS